MENKQPTEKKEIEKIVGYEAQYEKDHSKEYAKAIGAATLLLHSNKKGFKKAKGKDLQEANEIVQDYRRNKSLEYLKKHREMSEYYGIEIKAFFDKDFFEQTGMIRPSITVADFNPNKEIENVKPWSEALEENLALRINCNHELNEDETACKHCTLNPENWGDGNEGVSNEYNDKQRAKIEKQKEIEKECTKGNHELNDEAKENDKALAFCIHCRKPKDKWSNE